MTTERRETLASTLREAIGRYQDAHDRHDTAAALAACTPTARVVDDGHEFRGAEAISEWLTTAAGEFTFTWTLVSADSVGGDAWLVVNHLEGNFPGSVVDLRYQFVLTDGLISELVIAPSTGTISGRRRGARRCGCG